MAKIFATDAIMDTKQIMQALNERVAPQLSELGVEAFIIAGYIRQENDSVSRFTLGHSGTNAAYADGLRPVEIMATQWGAGKLG